MKRFIPFNDLGNHSEVVGVDCFHPKAFCLSHWRGANIHSDLQADTSTEIVINAVEQNIPELSFPVVTNNHFDIDGFMGVWCFMYPEMVKTFGKVFKQMALIGDFREYNPHLPESDLALKLVCWINKKEKELFYAPFGAQFTEQKEVQMCVDKYDWFLENLGDVLVNPEAYQADWEEEYSRVREDYRLIGDQGNREWIEDVRIQIVHAPRPVHYYALYAHSEIADMVLSIYPDNCYELEYKYTTWIDTATRKSFPRIQPEGLMDRLNKLEKSGNIWQSQKFTDTAPIISLNSNSFTKEQRFDHPFTRNVLSSSISEKDFVTFVTGFYRERLESAPQKSMYTWEEMRAYNRDVKERVV